MMLTMHISEESTLTHTAAAPGSPDGLAACLAQHGVSPSLIQTALAALAQTKTLVLYRPDEADMWQIADAQQPPVSPS